MENTSAGLAARGCVSVCMSVFLREGMGGVVRVGQGGYSAVTNGNTQRRVLLNC